MAPLEVKLLLICVKWPSTESQWSTLSRFQHRVCPVLTTTCMCCAALYSLIETPRPSLSIVPIYIVTRPENQATSADAYASIAATAPWRSQLSFKCRAREINYLNWCSPSAAWGSRVHLPDRDRSNFTKTIQIFGMSRRSDGRMEQKWSKSEIKLLLQTNKSGVSLRLNHSVIYTEFENISLRQVIPHGDCLIRGKLALASNWGVQARSENPGLDLMRTPR